jgi:hypothetical protein
VNFGQKALDGMWVCEDSEGSFEKRNQVILPNPQRLWI